MTSVTVTPVVGEGSSSVTFEAHPLRSPWRRAVAFGFEAGTLQHEDSGDEQAEVDFAVEAVSGQPSSLELSVGLWELRLEASGYSPRCTAVVVDGSPLDLGHRELRTFSPRGVKVLTPEGAPIEEAFVVEVVDEAELFEWSDCQTVSRSDASGRLEIDGGTDGPWLIGAAGFEPQVVESWPASGTVTLERSGRPVVLMASDEKGPIAGVVARVDGLPIGIGDDAGRIAVQSSGALELLAPDGRRLSLGEARPTVTAFPFPVPVVGRLVTYRDGDAVGVEEGVIWHSRMPAIWTGVGRGGAYDLPHVPIGRDGRRPILWIAGSAPLHHSETYDLGPGRPGSEERQQLLDLDLILEPRTLTGSFVGSVRMADGRLIAGAPVHLVNSEDIDQRAQLLSGHPTPRGARSSTTDDLGYFRIESPRPGALKDLLVNPVGAEPILVHGLTSPEVGEEVALGELSTEAPGRFEARVLDPDGRPLAGVAIAVERRIHVGDWSRSFEDLILGPLETDEAGRFSIPVNRSEEGLGGVELVLSKPGYRSRTLPRVVEPRSKVDVRLEPARPLSGLVTDLKGRPVAAARLLLSTDADALASGASGDLHVESDEILGTLSGPDGSFVLEDVPAPDRTVLRVDRSGFAIEYRLLASPLPPLLDIELAPESVIQGRVLKGDGTPVADAGIRLGDRRLLTSAEGRFEVRGLAEGTWIVEAHDPATGRAWVEVPLASGVTRQVEIILGVAPPATGRDL